MITEDKITAFLKLQQIVLDSQDSGKLVEQFLPRVLQELSLIGYPYIFLSAFFIDSEHKIKEQFFIDQNNKSLGKATKSENLFLKGSEWEMKVMYGEAAVVSDITELINPAYQQYSQIKSLLILPIQHVHELSGILVMASPQLADKVTAGEIEFGQMITRLIDFSYRLQDTENSLTTITQQVYEMNARLHQLDKLKDDFVSVASHELRTPMTAIRSYVWMALHRSDVPLSQKLERYLYRTLVSTERLISLVNDMLNVSRIESGHIEIAPKAMDMVTLVKDVFEEVRAKAAEKQLQLTMMEQQIPPVFADADKVHQILLNLIGNAMKFCYPGGTITVSFFADGQMLDVTVKDTGCGILKDDLSKLFHKFSRLDNSYTAISTSGGTGLGLFISKSLIEMMHGKIWASSEGTDKGSIFSFSLPIATAEVLSHSDDFKVRVEGKAKDLEPVAIDN